MMCHRSEVGAPSTLFLPLLLSYTLTDTMSMPENAPCHDPTYEELQALSQLPSFAQCPKEVQDGVKNMLDLIIKRKKFCDEVSSKSEVLLKLRNFTWSHDWKGVYEAGKTTLELFPRMLSGTLEGQFLKMLVAMQKPRRVLELGMFTGCGAVAMAEALPADGTLVTIDREPYLQEVAQNFFDGFPQGKKIQIKIGNVKDIMKELLADGQQFDMIFIDADKISYVDYYKIAMDEGLLAPGGTILADNALMGGRSYTAPKGNVKENPLGAFIDLVNADPRVEQVLVPMRDGVMIVRRKEDIAA